MIVALVFAAAVLAFAVSAVAGGGAGLVLVPLLRLLVPVQSVPAALSIGTAASSMARIRLFRRHVRWDVVRRFLPAALPAAGLGAWLLTLAEPAYVELLLGAFLLLNLPALLRRAPAAGPPLPLRRLPALGAVAGLLSGFTGAVGVVFNGAYLRLGLTRDEIVATRAVNEVLLHLLKVALYASFGLLSHPALAAGALVACAAVLASFAARRLLRRMPEELFRRAGLLAMVASGATMFSLSGGRVLRLHRAWVAVVAAGEEREVQLFWGGARRLAVEREDDGGLVVERAVPLATLPPAVRSAVEADAALGPVVLVEEVVGRRRLFEVYRRRGGAVAKTEYSSDGMRVAPAAAP